MVDLSADRIRAEAAQLRVGAALLTFLASPFYAIGWIMFWLLAGTLTVVKWVCAAVKIGYLDARTGAVKRGVTLPARIAAGERAGRSVGAR